MTVIFYDIPSTAVGKAWNATIWKTRFCLNYKQIPYTTEWIEYPDIKGIYEKLGVKPTSKKADGSDHYTLPLIQDLTTGVCLADSLLIAEYLDKTYPDTPPLFPSNTAGLQLAFFETFWSMFIPHAGGFALLSSSAILNPISQEYFRRTREEQFGVTLEEFAPQGERAIQEWKKLETNFGVLDQWYSKTDDLGPFLMGKDISWGDIMLASQLIWLKRVWGEDDQKWKDITGWQGGRWGQFMEKMEQYATVL